VRPTSVVFRHVRTDPGLVRTGPVCVRRRDVLESFEVRAITDDGQSIVGTAIKSDTVDEVKYVLQASLDWMLLGPADGVCLVVHGRILGRFERGEALSGMEGCEQDEEPAGSQAQKAEGENGWEAS
jgi:hypothetical protein